MQRDRSPTERESEREGEREEVRSRLRDFPSASVAHRTSYTVDVLRRITSSARFDWLFDAFGPIGWLRGRGLTGRVEGTDFQTYKKVFGNSEEKKTGFAVKRQPPGSVGCCVNMSTSLAAEAARSAGL